MSADTKSPILRIGPNTLLEHVKKMYANKDDLGNSIEDLVGFTALHIAVRANDLPVVKFLINCVKVGEEIFDVTDVYSYTPLHWATLLPKDEKEKATKLEIAKLLINSMTTSQIMQKAVCSADQTALHMAVDANNIDVVRILTQEVDRYKKFFVECDKYIDVEVRSEINTEFKNFIVLKNKYGQTALDLALIEPKDNNSINAILLINALTKQQLDEAMRENEQVANWVTKSRNGLLNVKTLNK